MRSPRPTALLFLSFFAAQASVLTLSVTLPTVARDVGVPVSTAGQLQTTAGLCGGIVALLLIALGERAAPSHLLGAGLATIAAGSAMSALAVGFSMLVVAEALLGAGLAATTTGAVAAVAVWTAPDERARVLAWALIGQPASWIVGMPIVGAMTEVSWRLTWVTLPLAAAALAGAGVLHRARREPPRPRARAAAAGVTAWRRPDVRLWAASDVLAGGAWAAALAYLGARLQDADRLSPSSTGLVLGATAAGYVAGSLMARNAVAHRPRTVAVASTVAALAGVAALGVTHDAPVVSTAIIGALMTVQGARTLANSALGLAAAPDRPGEVGGIRAAALQFGALGGAAIGGLALGAGGWPAWGLALAGLYAASLVPHGLAAARGRSPRPRRSRSALSARPRPAPRPRGCSASPR